MAGDASSMALVDLLAKHGPVSAYTVASSTEPPIFIKKHLDKINVPLSILPLDNASLTSPDIWDLRCSKLQELETAALKHSGLFVGHSLERQIEIVLYRMMRYSAVDGLSGHSMRS